MPPLRDLLEIFLVALRLGCTSFGGPIAHLGYFRAEYVGKRRWLDEAQYADLIALCQFLPGPASSQTGFAIGYLRRGLWGGLAAWLGFTLPSAVVMMAFAAGLSRFAPAWGTGWLHGLKVAAVAVVAQAVVGMWRTLCPDWNRSLVAGASAGFLLLVPSAAMQFAVIAVAALAGWRWMRPASRADEPVATLPPVAHAPAIASLFLFFALLVVLPVAARLTALPAVEVADRFYRAGALVFGGGHVVLPLLEREIVAPGWVTHDEFLAGYGAAQAVPGPLFTFSAFLGVLLRHGPHGVAGGGWALAWVFLPALLLVAGVLPYWRRLRHVAGVQSALRGANAAVVGWLLAALVHPVGTAAFTDPWSVALGLLAWAALQFRRWPAWLVVGLCALAGLWAGPA